MQTKTQRNPFAVRARFVRRFSALHLADNVYYRLRDWRETQPSYGAREAELAGRSPFSRAALRYWNALRIENARDYTRPRMAREFGPFAG